MSHPTRLSPMRAEEIAAGVVKPQNRRPPFFFVDRRTKNVIELTYPLRPSPSGYHWEELSIMQRAEKLLHLGMISAEDYTAVKRWHDGWPRRLARWLVAQLQRHC